MAKLNFQHHYSSLHNKYFFIIIIIAENSLSGFCHFGLVSFMSFLTEPWHSRHCHVFMWVRSSHALSRLRALFRAFGFVLWFGHSRSMFCLVVWVCGLEFARPRAHLSTCVLWSWTQFVFLSAACIHVMSRAVWHTACVFNWLRGFMLSCLVWTRGLWVFSLAACSCPVLHMADDLISWPCACVLVLCEHMALSFCVLCALLSICLDPTHLVSWLLVNLPHLCLSRFPPHYSAVLSPHLIPSPHILDTVVLFNIFYGNCDNFLGSLIESLKEQNLFEKYLKYFVTLYMVTVTFDQLNALLLNKHTLLKN